MSHSWLQVKPVASESWGVGCRVCCWYRHRSGIPGANELGQANLFVNMTVVGSSIQTPCLRRHARTKLHRLATAALRNRNATGSLPAPAASKFQELLGRLRACGLAQTCRGDRRRNATMAWCLYEAVRDDERDFLRQATCMSVAQDSRGNDVLTRYVASGGGCRQLEVRTGILQLQVGRAAGAMDLSAGRSQKPERHGLHTETARNLRATSRSTVPRPCSSGTHSVHH